MEYNNTADFVKEEQANIKSLQKAGTGGNIVFQLSDLSRKEDSCSEAEEDAPLLSFKPETNGDDKSTDASSSCITSQADIENGLVEAIDASDFTATTAGDRKMQAGKIAADIETFLNTLRQPAVVVISNVHSLCIIGPGRSLPEGMDKFQSLMNDATTFIRKRKPPTVYPRPKAYPDKPSPIESPSDSEEHSATTNLKSAIISHLKQNKLGTAGSQSQRMTFSRDDDSIRLHTAPDNASSPCIINPSKNAPEQGFFHDKELLGERHSDSSGHLGTTYDDKINSQSQFPITRSATYSGQPGTNALLTEDKISVPEGPKGKSDSPIAPPRHSRATAAETARRLASAGSARTEQDQRQSAIPVPIVIFASILLVLTVVPLLPHFLVGLLWGIYLASLVWLMFFWFVMPGDTQLDIDLTQDYKNNMASLHDSDTAGQEFENVVYKGWMNMMEGDYDPRTYHVGNTKSVLVRIDKNMLRLSIPKQGVLKHTCWNELKHESSFKSQQLYDIAGATVSLRPTNLAHRRWWSRKYPIAIIVPESARIGKSFGTGGSSLGLVRHAVTPDSDSDVSDSITSFKSARERKDSTVCIYLFGRSGREKQNWFKRLRYAACYYEFEAWKSRLLKSGHQIDMMKLQQDQSYLHSGRYTRRNSLPSEHEKHSELPSELKEGKVEQRRVRRFSHYDEQDVDDFPELAAEWLEFVAMNKQFSKYNFALWILMGKVEDFQPKAVALYMYELMSMKAETFEPKSGICSCELHSMTWRKEDPSIGPGKDLSPMYMQWANAFAGRVLWDCLRDPEWSRRIADRIERKLATVRLPNFIETLTLAELQPGIIVPKIISVSPPKFNEWGLWIDMKSKERFLDAAMSILHREHSIEYSGGFKLVLETKVNLMKLKTDPHGKPHNIDVKCGSGSYSDSEVPESPESSADEDPSPSFGSLSKNDSNLPKQKPGKKLLQIVDKIAQSKYFQEATDNKYIRKVMQGISETPLLLMVEVKHLDGVLSLNIPPPPNDRLWYGFRARPFLVLRAFPRVGDKNLNIVHITEWIENRLMQLFEKNLIIPNMDDLIIPVMTGSPLLRAYNL